MQRSGTLVHRQGSVIPRLQRACKHSETKLSPLVDKLGHLLLHLFALQLLLQEDLEARHRGGPLGVLLVGLQREEGAVDE